MTVPTFRVPPVAKGFQGDRVDADYTGWDVRTGDTKIVAIRSQGTAPAEISGIPAGFERGGKNGSIPAGDRVLGIFLRKVTNAEDEPAIHTFLGASGGGNSRLIIGQMLVRDPDFANLNDGGMLYQPGEAMASVQAGDVPFLLIALWGAEFTANVSVVPSVVPSNLTLRLVAQTAGGTPPEILGNEVVAGSRTGIIIGTQEVPAGGSKTIPAMTMGWAQAPTAVKSASVVIRGKLVDPPIGAPVKLADGRAARMSYLDANGVRRAPSRVSIWLPGFNDVEALVAKYGATMSHRGGSSNWPEYSEIAYDRSVFKGMGALEFSCAYSGDATPVLFGLGEQYLDRMAGVTGNIDPTTLPWATINSTYRNVLRPIAAGVSQPLYRLEKFLEKYTPNHVVLVDPKFGFANAAKVKQLIDMCKAIGGPDKVVIKFDSPVTNMVLVDQAKAAGFQTMNYWGTEVEKLTPAYGTDKWDLIGVRYDANQAMYDAANAIGKPIWGAVIPDQAGYDLAMTRGADLAMVANVAGIKTVR